MGGASRAEKRRKQQAAEEKLRRAGITPPQPARDNRRTTFIAVAALAVVGLVVGIVALVASQGSDEAVVPTHPVAADGGIVVAGTGPIVVDVYSDYLCPVCERFEERYGTELTEAMNAGQITVRYHNVAILDEATTPPGYSTRAANAARCAVDAGVYPAYQDRLFAEQPAEGGAGLSDEQLIAFGRDLGADLTACVTGGTHVADVTAVTAAAVADPAARNADGRFGTPTVLLNGARVDITDTDWLQDALPA
jgi:protein-disulfide isomerase